VILVDADDHADWASLHQSSLAPTWHRPTTVVAIKKRYDSKMIKKTQTVLTKKFDKENLKLDWNS
jgi:hypothetical protein